MKRTLKAHHYNKRVYVYYNLHKKVWSVKALEGADKGRVIAHLDSITLHDCTFKVSEAGRQRVLQEQRKNVHAGVVGTLSMLSVSPDVDDMAEVTYNPYKYTSFVNKSSESPIQASETVHMSHRRVWAS